MSTDPPAAVGRCLACDYPLRDLTTPRCPECGRAFNPTDPSTMNLSGRPLVRGLTRWVLKPVGWWTVAAALLLTAGLYWFTWLPFVGEEARRYLDDPAKWPYYGWCEGWTYAGLTATAKKWYEGHYINLCDTRTVLLLVLAGVVLGAWIAGWTALSVVAAAVQRRVRELLRAAWRRWACLAALGLLFWSGLKYDLAFHAAAWLSGPAIDRLAADITSRPPQFRYPDRQVGLFPAKHIYWKDNTVGFQLDRPMDRVSSPRQGQWPPRECWMKVYVGRSADGRSPVVDEDTERPMNPGGIYRRTAFDVEYRWEPRRYRYHAGQLWVAWDTNHQASPWIRARRRLAVQVGGQADPAIETLRGLVGELVSGPAEWGYSEPYELPIRRIGPPAAPPPPDADEFLLLPVHTMLLGPEWMSRWPRSSPAFRELVHVGAKAVPALVEALDSARPDLAELAAIVLAQMGPVAAPAEDRLVALLGQSNRDVARAAMFALYRMETTSAASLPGLVAALESPDSCLRRYAMQNLRFVDAPPETLRPVFRRALWHADRQVRYRAALGLWQIGLDAAAVADLRAALEDVDRRAATQPQRSDFALGLDDGLRIVCAAAIQQAVPDDVHARVVLTDFADRVSGYLRVVEAKRDGVPRPRFAGPAACVPRLAWAVLAESVTGWSDWYRAMYLRRLAADRADPLDVRDERLASSAMLRLLQPPDVSVVLHKEACRRAVELATHRLHGHRVVGEKLGTSASELAPTTRPGKEAMEHLQAQQSPRHLAWLDIEDAAVELSLDDRVAAAEQFFALAQCRPGLLESEYPPLKAAAWVEQARLRQAILERWRQVAPEQMELSWGVQHSSFIVHISEVPDSRRREALRTLADLAKRPGKVGDSAREAIRSVLGRASECDAGLFAEAFAAQIELDQAAAEVGWVLRQRTRFLSTMTRTTGAAEGLKLARVLADAGWLPQQDWADLEARADSEDPAVRLAVVPVLSGLIKAARPLTADPSVAPAGR